MILRQLKNKYHNELGRIKREFDFTHPNYSSLVKKACLQLNTRTLFSVYQILLQTNVTAAEAEASLDFFCQILSKGAPAEAMICAAVALESKESKNLQKNVEKICSDWGGNLHLAMQFAVIEFLTDANQLGKIDWYSIIKTFLLLGADPNYPSKTFQNSLTTEKFCIPIPELKSAYEMIAFHRYATHETLKMAHEFAVHEKKFSARLMMTSQRFAATFPRATNSYISNPRLTWLINNFLDFFKEHLFQQAEKIILDVAAYHDYDSIDFFHREFGLNPFPILLKFALSEKNLSRILTFDYLEKKHENQLKIYFEENRHKHDFINKFIELNAVSILQRFAKDSDAYAVHIFKKIPIENWCEAKPFQWLQTHCPDSIKRFFDDENNKNIALKLLGSATDKIKLVYSHNIELYAFYNSLSNEDQMRLNPYYQQRAKWILDFIFKQSYPKTGKPPVGYQGKSIYISAHLTNLVIILFDVLFTPNSATKLFKTLYVEAKRLPEDVLQGYPAEREIYKALKNNLCDHTLLSQYVHREFSVYKDCIPFLMGLDSKESAIGKMTRESHFDRNVLSQIFRFMGNYGLKDGTEEKTLYINSTSDSLRKK